MITDVCMCSLHCLINVFCVIFCTYMCCLIAHIKIGHVWHVHTFIIVYKVACVQTCCNMSHYSEIVIFIFLVSLDALTII